MLLNVCQDQSMKDEGLAREVINLVQKLRKEAHVTPSDAVTVYYEVRHFVYSFCKAFIVILVFFILLTRLCLIPVMLVTLSKPLPISLRRQSKYHGEQLLYEAKVLLRLKSLSLRR